MIASHEPRASRLILGRLAGNLELLLCSQTVKFLMFVF